MQQAELGTLRLCSMWVCVFLNEQAEEDREIPLSVCTEVPPLCLELDHSVPRDEPSKHSDTQH